MHMVSAFVTACLFDWSIRVQGMLTSRKKLTQEIWTIPVVTAWETFKLSGNSLSILLRYTDGIKYCHRYRGLHSTHCNKYLICTSSQAHQRKYLKAIADRVEKNNSGPQQIGLINSMRTIGVSCPDILGEHRKLLETLRNRADLKDMCQATIDVIEGRRWVLFPAPLGGCWRTLYELFSSFKSQTFQFVLCL